MKNSKAHKWVDEQIEDVEKRLSSIYKREADELEEKAKKFFEGFKKRDDEKRKLVSEGKLTEQKYNAWRQGQIMTGKHWVDFRSQAVDSLKNASKQAVDIVNDKLPEVYAVCYNEAGKEGKFVKGHTFELVNKNAVAELAKRNKTLLPYKKIGDKKFERWNTKNINAEVLQGILQGESVEKLAKRLRNVTEMDRTSSIRNARTALGSAESKGTLDGMKKLQDDGLIVRKAWRATHDGRARDSHLRFEAIGPIDLDDEFDTGLEYPCDPDGAPEEVYNCRCYLETVIVGYNGRRF